MRSKAHKGKKERVEIIPFAAPFKWDQFSNSIYVFNDGNIEILSMLRYEPWLLLLALLPLLLPLIHCGWCNNILVAQAFTACQSQNCEYVMQAHQIIKNNKFVRSELKNMERVENEIPTPHTTHQNHACAHTLISEQQQKLSNSDSFFNCMYEKWLHSATVLESYWDSLQNLRNWTTHCAVYKRQSSRSLSIVNCVVSCTETIN